MTLAALAGSASIWALASADFCCSTSLLLSFRATLPDRGFTAHVKGYTLHAVLEAVVSEDKGFVAESQRPRAFIDCGDTLCSANFKVIEVDCKLTWLLLCTLGK